MTRVTLTTDATRAHLRRVMVELFGLIEVDRPIHVDGNLASVTTCPDDAAELRVALAAVGRSAIIRPGEYATPQPEGNLRTALEALHATLTARADTDRAALERAADEHRSDTPDGHYIAGRYAAELDAALAIAAILKGQA